MFFGIFYVARVNGFNNTEWLQTATNYQKLWIFWKKKRQQNDYEKLNIICHERQNRRDSLICIINAK